MLQSLPLGRSTFSALRAKNEIYVDKTRFIYELARSDSKIFLARPRRFGKSLLTSTFESLFKHGLRDFKELAIENLWNDKTYNVVRLDFSEAKEFVTADDFRKVFYARIGSKFREVGFKESENGDDFVTQLSTWLRSLDDSSLVLLIDEYDAPLTSCLNNKDLFNAVRSIMSELFLTLKSNEGCLRFFFMTGITKFSNTSIFSAFNNLLDISLYPQFGTLLGYTEAEIKLYFKDHLVRATEQLQLTVDQVIENLKENYDGFSFDMKAETHVFCPWSVLNFLSYPELGFKNFWYTSGGQPTVLMKYLDQHALSQPISYSENKMVRLSDLNTSRQYDEISLEVLLTQAGYLTIRSVMKNGYAILGYPNQEVSTSMAQLYSDELLKGHPLEKPQNPMISDTMANGKVEDVIEAFNRAVAAIDYHRYPITDEASCRAYLQVLLIGAAMIPRVEVHNALGRSDMEVDIGKRHWVFEFKYAKENDCVSDLLEKAETQVKNRQYGLQHGNQELIRIAIVFSGKERRFCAWKCV